MQDSFNDLALTDALRAAVNVLRDSAEARRMPSGEALPEPAAAAHAHAADLLEEVLQDAAALAGRLPRPGTPQP